MAGNEYSSNGWGYFHVGPSLSAKDVAGRICSSGLDGFDLLVGDDAYPSCGIDEKDEVWEGIRLAAEEAGGKVSSLTLVSCPLQDEAECLKQFKLAPKIAKCLGTNRVNLLPRKIGIGHGVGFDRLGRIWKEAGKAFGDEGMSVCAENHVWSSDADEDLFLLRTEADFNRLIEVTDGGIRVKFDPVWLLKPGAGEQPVPAFERLLPYVDILDLKDCTFPEGNLVPPGGGAVDFEALAELAVKGGIRRFAVETEHHMQQEPALTEPEAIDEAHISDLCFYKSIFGN